MEFVGIISWLSLVVSFSAVLVAFLVARFYGERWVEMSRIRREHSMILSDRVLRPWIENINKYCKIDAKYSEDDDRMMGVEPTDPADLEFFDVGKSHMESGYPDILVSWEELKHVTFEHNNKLANLLEEIRTAVINELKMPCLIYSIEPEEYVSPRFAKAIYAQIEYTLEYRPYARPKWRGGEPYIQPVNYGGKQFYELAWQDNRIVRSLDEEKTKQAKLLVDHLIETPGLIEKTKLLMDEKSKTYGAKLEALKTKMMDVIKSIELGNIIAGKCRFCP